MKPISRFNRIALRLIGVTPICVMIYVAIDSSRDLSVVPAIVILGMSLPTLILVFFVVNAMIYRDRSFEELASLDFEPLPELSADSLVCRFSGTFGGSKAVIVDFEAEQVYFHHCHIPRGFLTREQAESRCSFADLVAVHRNFGRRGISSLTIVTSTGKTVVPSDASSFEDLCARLPGLFPLDDTKNPAMAFLHVVAAVVGVLAGLGFAPPLASPGTLLLCMVVGAIVLITLVRFGIRLFNRWLKLSIFEPIIAGILGIILGCYCVYRLPPGTPWPAVWLPPLLLGIACFVIGSVRQSRCVRQSRK